MAATQTGPSRQIAIRHFGYKIITVLARRGIRVIGTQALPDEQGSFLNSRAGYVVDDNGTDRIWTYFQVVDAAR